MLFNIHTGAWDQRTARPVSRSRLADAEVRRPPAKSTEKSAAYHGLDGIPLAGIAGDQQAALFGQRCIRPGLTKNTYGTGCFMLQNTGRRAVPSSNRLVTTVAWKIGDTTEYALEGSVFVGGAVVQWLRDGLGLIRKSARRRSAGKVRPRQWRRLFRSRVRGTRRAALGFLRARLDLRTDSRHDRRPSRPRGRREHRLSSRRPARRHAPRLRRLRYRNFASTAEPPPTTASCNFNPTFSECPVVRPAVTETTALGAAYLAGLAVDFWKSGLDASVAGKDRRFEPQMPPSQARALRNRWNEAVSRTRNWQSVTPN